MAGRQKDWEQKKDVTEAEDLGGMPGLLLDIDFEAVAHQGFAFAGPLEINGGDAVGAEVGGGLAIWSVRLSLSRATWMLKWGQEERKKLSGFLYSLTGKLNFGKLNFHINSL